VLIPSPRLTAADLAEWGRLERYDAALSGSPRLARMADRARAVIEEFAAAAQCRAGTSWGKDSVLVAYLLATSSAATRVPLAWVRSDTDPPECEQVRDAFLARFPAVRYEEIRFRWRVPLRGEPGFWDAPRQDALREETAHLPPRYISGVRAAESGKRRTAMRAHGTATARTCRPIGWWETENVFAYLHGQRLPVHPAYAMTGGGAWRRDQVRVHAIGAGEEGTGFGRDRWEDCYYGDVLAEHRRRAAGRGSAELPERRQNA
jgi:phosphoadenosine phosphosulfate reductase